ncbi:MAG: hybrid sensor histidine kinase/response regulator, partial [Bacteroidales bacterium]|nr:hybrid sensor histidine kinase/response regulator [Bacteroidales bacterium]
MKNQILILAAGLLAGLMTWANAASLPAHKFTKYSSEDGLEEYIIQNIMQDHRGLMWFATWDGLYNYDGYRFRRFKAGSNGVRPANNRLDQLSEDIYGRLWMVSYDGLAYTFDPVVEQFEQVLPEGIQVARIRLMADGTTWLISQQQELFMARRETADGALAITDFFTTNQLRRPSRINGVQMDRDGRHWIMTEEGIYRYDAQSQKVMVVANAAGYEMVEREGGDTCYIGSRNGTIIEVTQGGRSTRNIELGTYSSIKMLRAHPSGRLVACSASQGLWLYDTASATARHISRATHGALANDTIRDIYIDRLGELWLRTNRAGVVHYRPTTDEARRFILHDMYGREITDSREDQMEVEDQNGLLWVHPSGGGLAWYDRERDELVPFYNPDLQNRWSNANKLTALYSDRQGNLWFGSYGNGLEKASFSLYPFAVRSYDDKALDFAGNNVRAVLQDRDGRIWAGGKDRVVRLYDADYRFVGNLCSDGSVRTDREESLGIVYTFMQSRDGVIWCGTKGDGLWMLTPEGEATPSAKNQRIKFKIRRFVMADDNVYSLNCNDIYSLWEDHNGRIWIATYRSGVNIMQRGADGAPERFYNTRNELTSYPLISCFRSRYITGDERGNVWIGTTSGLLTCPENFAAPNKLKFKHFRHDKNDPTSIYSNDVHGI